MENNEKETPEALSDASITTTDNSDHTDRTDHIDHTDHVDHTNHATEETFTGVHSADSISSDGLAPAKDVLGLATLDAPALDEGEEAEPPVLPEELPIEQQKEERKKHPSPMRESLRQFQRDTRAMISVGFLAFLVLLAIFGPPIYQHIGGTYQSDLQGKIGPTIYHRYDHQELSKANQNPSAEYPLGTDSLGEDMLARLMQGLIISLSVAALVEVIDISFGVVIGVLAGYYGGWIDMLLARFTDLIFAFPGLLFAILLTGIFGQNANDYFSGLPIIGGFLGNGNASLVIVSLALAIVSWPMMARYVRGQTLQLKQQQFVEAARTSGTNDLRIMFKHIVPNLFNIVIVVSTMNIAGTIIGESTLSLLGLGVVHPGSSLGLMIADGVDILDVHPWNTLFPTIVLTLIVLAISFIGDGLRDAFDPRAKS